MKKANNWQEMQLDFHFRELQKISDLNPSELADKLLEIKLTAIRAKEFFLAAGRFPTAEEITASNLIGLNNVINLITHKLNIYKR